MQSNALFEALNSTGKVISWNNNETQSNKIAKSISPVTPNITPITKIIEDALDGEIFTDDSHDWKDYLGAGISGILGSMSGGKAMQLSVPGGMIDAWISGDIEENGSTNSWTIFSFMVRCKQ